MISDDQYKEAYVWIWLPNESEPVVAGLLTQEETDLVFNYGRSYLDRKDGIAIYDRELPLKAGIIPPRQGLKMPGCIRDASPDAWGRRVLINRRLGLRGADAANMDLSELSYLLESGSDRIGALDFQESATQYTPRITDQATLEELMQAAERVENGLKLPPDLQKALQHGSSLGGARPKTLITADHKKYIAKFSKNTDHYNVVKAEFIAMRLARLVGLNVAYVELTHVLGKDVLLIERFDREKKGDRTLRKSIVSALTLLELDEMMAGYASYQDLAEIVRHRFTDPKATLRELYARIVFNILCGNTDDHARNHAAFWDGTRLILTPAYDICPQARTGNEATQAMFIHDTNRMSQISVCLAAARIFLLENDEATTIIVHQVETIRSHWASICDEAELPPVDRDSFWRRQFLNPFAFYGSPTEITAVAP
jgi:serine/threonine-protein kinase HipA